MERKKKGISGKRNRHREPKTCGGRSGGGGGGGGREEGVNLHRGGRSVMNHVISGLAADALLKNSEFTSIFVCNF